jgi:hypothetical protein
VTFSDLDSYSKAWRSRSTPSAPITRRGTPSCDGRRGVRSLPPRNGCSGVATRRRRSSRSPRRSAVQGVYAAFGNKRTILLALLDATVAGDDESVPVIDRVAREVDGLDSPAARLARVVRFGSRAMQRSAEVHRIVRSAAVVDAEVRPASPRGRRGATPTPVRSSTSSPPRGRAGLPSAGGRRAVRRAQPGAVRSLRPHPRVVGVAVGCVGSIDGRARARPERHRRHISLIPRARA